MWMRWQEVQKETTVELEDADAEPAEKEKKPAQLRSN
jgi:hypothetical protein